MPSHHLRSATRPVMPDRRVSGAFRRTRRALILLGVTVVMATPQGVFAQIPGTPPAEPSIPELEARVVELSQGGDPIELGRSYRALATAYQAASRHTEAVEAIQEAVRVFSELDLPDELAQSHNDRGLILWLLARYDGAVRAFEEARSLWEALGDTGALGRVHNNLGSTHYQWGNYEAAMEAFLRALPYRREVGDVSGEARVLANLGLTYHDWGQYDRARQVLEEAVGIADGVGDRAVQGYSRQILGALHLTLGELDEAEAVFNRALTFYPRDGQTNTLASLSLVHVRRGEPERAVPTLLEILRTAREQGVPRHEARALLHLGEAYRVLGEVSQAIGFLEEGLEVARAWDQRPIALQMLEELAVLHEMAGNPEFALRDLRAANVLRDSIFDQAVGQRIASMEARAEADRQTRENLRLREVQQTRELLIQRQRAGVLVGGVLLLAAMALVAVLAHFNRLGKRREALLTHANTSLEKVNAELLHAVSEVRTLKGLIPICAHCKRVRDDEGYWETVEKYIAERSEVLFSHSICASCGPDIYGPDWEESVGRDELDDDGEGKSPHPLEVEGSREG